MSKRAVITTLAFFIAIPSIYWLLGEATVLFEMISTEAHSRAELSDDFGLGLLWLFVVLPGTLIGAIIAASFTWWYMGPRRQGQMPNKSFKADGVPPPP